VLNVCEIETCAPTAYPHLGPHGVFAIPCPEAVAVIVAVMGIAGRFCFGD